MSAVSRATLLRAFARARWGYRFADRRAFLGWQHAQLMGFLQGPLRRAPFYRDLAAQTVTDLPVVDKPRMLAAFEAFNSVGVSLRDALAVAERAERERDFAPSLPGGVTVGLSSGTSGQRGVFLVSARERSVWAGTMLARILTPQHLRRLLNPLAAPLRVAFFLRANSNLYTSVQSRRLRFAFYDLLQPLDALAAAAVAQQPDVLVAPASVLRALAQQRLRIAPAQVVSVAEVLEDDDRAAIVAAWGVAPAQVYQCTEGLLGQTCSHGSLHLNEEFVHFEPEWLDAARTRFVPRLTDFSRTTQVFARFRLDDVLRVDPTPCPCGRVTTRIAAIEGRCDDVLWLPSLTSDALAPLFPDLVRRAFALAAPHCADYRVEQRDGACTVRLQPQADTRAQRDALAREWQATCAQAGLRAPGLQFAPWQDPPAHAKRRRITRVTPPHAAD